MEVVSLLPTKGCSIGEIWYCGTESITSYLTKIVRTGLLGSLLVWIELKLECQVVKEFLMNLLKIIFE